MAYFAKIGMNGLVIEIVEIHNDTCLDSEGEHNETIGAQHLENITYWPTQMWKETKQDGSIRKNFASVGGKYDNDRDAFIDKKTHSSRILDETTCQYKAPVTQPSGANLRYTKDGEEKNYKIVWDETNEKFVGERLEEDPITLWDWNPDTSSWNAQ